MLKLYTTLLSFIIVASAFGDPAEGESTSRSHTLQEVLSLTLMQNPELAVFSHDIRAADALILQSSFSPNPQLNVILDHFGGTGRHQGYRRAELYGIIEQQIERGGKRLARMREAQAKKNLVEMEYEIKKWNILAETSQRYTTVLAKQKMLEMYQKHLEAFEAIIPEVKKRVEAGKAHVAEEQKFDITHMTVKLEFEQAKRELFLAKQRLGMQWGELDVDQINVQGDLELEYHFPSLVELLKQLPSTPSLLRLEIEKTYRQARVHIEESNAVPDINIQAGIKHYSERNERSFIVGFTIPIPLFNTNRGNIHSTIEQYEKTRDEWEVMKLRISSEITSYYQSFEKAKQEIMAYQQVILPAVERSYNMIREGYLQSKFNYFELLEAQRTLYNTQIQFIHAAANYNISAAQISGILGTW